MSNRFCLCVVLSVALFSRFASAQEAGQLAKEEQEQGFVSLFNGADLSGWVVMGKKEQWLVEGGIIKCLGGPGGWLRSEKPYTDFALRLEFRNKPKTNSGVFLRATEQGNPAFTGMEVQIMDDAGRPTPSKSGTGALYAAVAPAVTATKPPGEWNAYDITLKGMQLKVVLNGQELYNVDLADPKLNEEVRQSAEQRLKAAVAKAEKEGKTPPQAPEYKPFTERAKTGFIGLQNHGQEVEFRNIRVKTLD